MLKKKITERPLAFRAAALKTAVKAEPVNAVAVAGGNNTGNAPENAALNTQNSTAGTPASTPPASAKLIIEQDKTSAQKASPPKAPVIKLGALSKLREQVAQSNKSGDAAKVKIPLEINLLRQKWQEYADKLRAAKNPAVQSFELAELRIIDDNNFTIVSANNLEQKFIEGEKRDLAEFIQEAFCNPTIQLHFVVEEDPNRMDQYEKPLTAREVFMEMNEQFPLLNELRVRLKLEINSF